MLNELFEEKRNNNFVTCVGFLAEDNKSLCHYANNIEDLFVNKMCEAYLGTARNIMKKDLHEIKQVGPVSVGHLSSPI